MIPVCFSDRMAADSGAFSPSAGKPVHVLASWQARGFPIDVFEPEPLSADDLAVAHDPTMVEDILAGRRSNGFGNRSPEVARTLPYTSGAMVAAAERALDTRRVAAATCSGFHHACYASTGGFCTFNGLMVTACLLRRRRGLDRVAILDFDEHYGNGTEDIIRHLGIDWIVHDTAGRHGYRPAQAEAFLSRIPAILETMGGCDVVLYQAGADPHVDDPLGGFLTTEQLYRRDRSVFEWCRRLGLPVAWNLAGGYQKRAGFTGAEEIRPVLDIHDNTMKACVEVYEHGVAHPVPAGT